VPSIVPPRRLLVVTTAPLEEPVLRERIRQHTGGEDAELKIVAPAAKLSPLQWLASDEDRAREEAAAVAEESATAVEDDVVETEVGDPDPVQAIEDALRTFPADEVLLVTQRDEEASWLEEDAGAQAKDRFGVPITHLAV
jgi:hypothetical protein